MHNRRTDYMSASLLLTLKIRLRGKNSVLHIYTGTLRCIVILRCLRVATYVAFWVVTSPDDRIFFYCRLFKAWILWRYSRAITSILPDIPSDSSGQLLSLLILSCRLIFIMRFVLGCSLICFVLSASLNLVFIDQGRKFRWIPYAGATFRCDCFRSQPSHHY